MSIYFTQYLSIPKANPFRFVKSQHADEYFFKDGIPTLEQQAEYKQIWQPTDTMTFQLRYNPAALGATEIACELVDCELNVYATFLTQFLYTDSNGWIYMHYYNTLQTSSSAVFPDGQYFIRIAATLSDDATVDTFYSEPICIKQEHENSVLIGYRHSANDYGMIFQKRLIDLASEIANGEVNAYDLIKTAPLYQIRVKGGVWSKDEFPTSDDSTYKDITANQTLLSSVPYNTFSLSIADNNGIPNWLIDKLNRAFSCEFVRIEDSKKRYYREYVTKTEGATFEQVAFADKYPMGCWKIELMKYENDYTKTYRPLMYKSGIGSIIIGNGFTIEEPLPTPTFEAVLMTQDVIDALDELNGEVIPTSIIDKIDGAKTSKENIRLAIVAQGVACDTSEPLSDYDDKIAAIGGGFSYEAETEALWLRVATLGSTWKDAYNDLILILKGSGIWTTLDVLHVLGTGDATDALLNIVKNSSNATLVNAPTFTAKAGYMTNGTNGYVRTNYRFPADFVNMTNDAGFFMYHISEYGAAGYNVAGVGEAGSRFSMYEMGAVGANATAYMNSAGGSVGCFSGVGSYLVNRVDSANITTYHCEKDAAVGSVTMTGNFDFWLGALNNGGSLFGAGANRYSFFAAGSVLSDSQARLMQAIPEWWFNRIRSL